MEISTMVMDLKRKIETVEKETKSLSELENTLRQRLATVEATIRSNTDDLEAMKMAMESLELIGGKKPVAKEKPAVVSTPKPAPAPAKQEHMAKSTAPKKVRKCDAMGNQLGIWVSINQCAREHKLSPQTIVNMIEKQPRAVLLASRGYYFTYAT